MRRRQGFTLIELLVAIGIIAILASMMAPVIREVKNAVGKTSASESLKQIGLATTLYMDDWYDQYPPAITRGGGPLLTWFGAMQANGEFDSKQGFISPYVSSRLKPDPTHQAKKYMGDHSGFGYNYCYIGSDFCLINNFRGFPNCENPSTGSGVARPSETVVYATSSFYSATWLPGGTGYYYDFGFIDAPRFWQGNPNVDFRHQGKKEIDTLSKRVVPSGFAIFCFGDGRVKPLQIGRITDSMFMRDPGS